MAVRSARVRDTGRVTDDERAPAPDPARLSARVREQRAQVERLVEASRRRRLLASTVRTRSDAVLRQVRALRSRTARAL